MSDISFEDKYLSVLQNIEAAILNSRRNDPNLVDLQVDNAVDYLIRTYQAESSGRPNNKAPSGASGRVYNSIKMVTEWRLGRQGYKNDMDNIVFVDKPITEDEIIDCLKRIRKSIKTWNKSNGRQGYLDYIAMFIK